MAEKYDCTKDVTEHINRVRGWMRSFYLNLEARAENHDASKLKEPEKSMFDHWTPKLKEFEFGSDEYKIALAGMGEGLKHHYENNRHHPEHYENGVNGMTLNDVIEMVADWMAAAEAKSDFVNLEYLATRFGLSEQLVDIIANTLREEDVWNAANGHATDFCPPNRRKGHVEGFERGE